jgi:hypothetical protein
MKKKTLYISLTIHADFASAVHAYHRRQSCRVLFVIAHMAVSAESPASLGRLGLS